MRKQKWEWQRNIKLFENKIKQTSDSITLARWTRDLDPFDVDSSVIRMSRCHALRPERADVVAKTTEMRPTLILVTSLYALRAVLHFSTNQLSSREATNTCTTWPCTSAAEIKPNCNPRPKRRGESVTTILIRDTSATRSPPLGAWDLRYVENFDRSGGPRCDRSNTECVAPTSTNCFMFGKSAAKNANCKMKTWKLIYRCQLHAQRWLLIKTFWPASAKINAIVASRSLI